MKTTFPLSTFCSLPNSTLTSSCECSCCGTHDISRADLMVTRLDMYAWMKDNATQEESQNLHVHSTLLTDARQSASDAVIQKITRIRHVADGLGCTRVRKQTRWAKQLDMEVNVSVDLVSSSYRGARPHLLNRESWTPLVDSHESQILLGSIDLLLLAQLTVATSTSAPDVSIFPISACQ